MNKLLTTITLLFFSAVTYAQSTPIFWNLMTDEQRMQQFSYTKRLAEQGDVTAQYDFGYFYEFGRGVPENHAEAVKWYRLAAEQGNAIAQYTLGYKYDNGDGVPENDVEAVKWHRLAAEQGDIPAQNELRNLLANVSYGQDVPDFDETKRLAEQGYAFAQYNLGFMYRNGEGVPQNKVRAYVWFSVATAQGYETARTNRDTVADRLTPEQRARGQDMATRCFESDFQDCE